MAAESALIRAFNNSAEMVRICEAVKGQIVPILRNGMDELYVMDYETYKMKKNDLAQSLRILRRSDEFEDKI